MSSKIINNNWNVIWFWIFLKNNEYTERKENNPKNINESNWKLLISKIDTNVIVIRINIPFNFL